MGHVNRRIGKSSETANVSVDGTGGGVLDSFLQTYFNRSGNLYNAPGNPASGHVASGGIISDYTDGPAVYRAHIFTNSGTFNITSLGTFGNTVDCLVVAGGGGGGGANAAGPTGGYTGGGGAGGFRTGTSLPVSTSPGSYTVTVGSGGAGGVGTTARSCIWSE